MSFNPDLRKQSHGIIPSRKSKRVFYPSLHFSISILLQNPYQNYVGIFLDAQITFEEHLK